MYTSYRKVFVAILLVCSVCLLAACNHAAVPAESAALSAESTENGSAGVLLSDAEQTKLYEAFLTKAICEGDFLSGVEAGWFETSRQDEMLFAYYDIDANGVKELLLGEDGSALLDRAEKIVQHIYTISGGKVVRQNFFGFFAEFNSEIPVILKNGAVKTGGPTSDGDVSYSYYKFNQDELVNVCTLRYWPQDDSSYTVTTADGTQSITEEAYTQWVRKLEDNAEPVDTDALIWRKMTDFLDKSAKRDVLLDPNDTVEVMVQGRDTDYRRLSDADAAYVISVLSNPDGDGFSGFCFDSYSWNPTGSIQFRIGEYLFDFDYSGNPADYATVTNNVRTHGFLNEKESQRFYAIFS